MTHAHAGDDLQQHARLLWGIAYRMTGVAADADDVVQETFARALAKPPARDRPVRPWLIKVAMNIARDLLRRRRRVRYEGPWLPSPVDDDAIDIPDLHPSPEQRYSLKESATFAFLLAVEALTPMRRAVLILRDVFDLSTEETAAALGISSDAVKQNLSRARRALALHDAMREPLAVKRERDERALGKLFFALMKGDTDAVVDLLADDVEARSDGGGEFTAARIVVRGAEKVALVYRNLSRLVLPTGIEMRTLNGSAAVILAFAKQRFDVAPRSTVSVDTDPRGKIVRIYTVLATRKLAKLA